MYIDIIVLVVLVVLVLMFFRRFSSFIFCMVIIDIFLRLVTFVANNIGVIEVKNIIAKYFPSSLSGIAAGYTGGIILTIVNWCIFAIYVVFLFYIVKIFLKKKKI